MTKRFSNSMFRTMAIFALALMMVTLTGTIFAQKGGKGGGGGTPSPTPVPTPVPIPLPQTAPAPGVLYRESFGNANLARPTGTKGTLKSTYLHTGIQGFWIEYPGSRNTQWIASSTGQQWNLCGASINPYEMFSPIQFNFDLPTNGCVVSDWFDAPTTNPTALMPVTLPATPYEVSLNGYPAPIDGKYLALGLTSSPALYSNLADGGTVVLVQRPTPGSLNFTIQYELRTGGMDGTLLASGETYNNGWNQMTIHVDPVAHTVGGSINGTDLGTFPLDIGVPKYAGFEGVAIADNFVIRSVQ